MPGIKFSWIVILFIIILFNIPKVYAGIPPPEYRAGYLLPASHDAHSYYWKNDAVSPNNAYNTTTNAWDILSSSNYTTDERFLESDHLYPAEFPHPETPFGLFPVLSGYWRSQTYIDFPNHSTFIALNWYCDNHSAFITEKNNLLDYLNQHGIMKNTTVDLSAARARTKNQQLIGLEEKPIPVIQYESDSTSGYFIFHDAPAFSGDKYRISYYGTTGTIRYYANQISDFGTPGTIRLTDADSGIRRLMVKRIYNLIEADTTGMADFGANVSQDSSMPNFPNLSPYRGYKKLTFLKTGEQFISEVWFFNDRDLFVTEKQNLLIYLKEWGTVSAVSLNFSQDEANTTTQWNVTQYKNRDTSGYFFVYESSEYPGTNLYILYYGVVGLTSADKAAHPLKLLILNVLQPSSSIHNLDSPLEEYLPDTSDRSKFPIFPSLGILVLLIGGSALYWNIRRRK